MLGLPLGRITAVVVCVVGVFCAPGCVTAVRRAQPGIQSRDAAERVRAIKQAAGRGDTTAVPHLVDRLEDEDGAVRFAAIMALRKLTGVRAGYRYGDPEAAAVAAWRRHVRRRGVASASESPSESR